MSEFCSKRFESTNFHQLNISPLFLSSDSFLKVMTRVRKPQNIYTKKEKKKITQREKDRGAIIQMPDMFGWWKASREKNRLDSKMAAYQKKKDRQTDLIYNNFLMRTCCLSRKTGQVQTMCYTNSSLRRKYKHSGRFKCTDHLQLSKQMWNWINWIRDHIKSSLCFISVSAHLVLDGILNIAVYWPQFHTW